MIPSRKKVLQAAGEAALALAVLSAYVLIAMVLMGLCLVFALLILAGGAACRLYEWIKYDVLKEEEE